MTTISANSDSVTLINVFTVEPANQRRLVELLTEATEVSVRHAPGFVSASLHRSTDGTKVTMVAQWRSIDDYQAMREDPAALPYLQEARRSPASNPASTRWCEPSRPQARRIDVDVARRSGQPPALAGTQNEGDHAETSYPLDVLWPRLPMLCSPR